MSKHRRIFDAASEADSGTGRGSSTPRDRPREQTSIGIALVHDWLNGARGGEAVFEAILDLFPQDQHPHIEVYTLLYDPRLLSPTLREKLSRIKVYTSFLNRFTFFHKYYRHLLPILPLLISLFRITAGTKLVISSSHCVAKGIPLPKGAKHICYIHAPMRYMWSRFEDYFAREKVGRTIRLAAKICRPFLQMWDRYTARPAQVHKFIANSQFVANQVQEFYGRQAKVIYPFADLERFFAHPLPERRGAFYLMVGAFAPNKRVDLAVEAFSRLGLPLKIVGGGQTEADVRKMIADRKIKNVELLGHLPNEQINALYRECRAFLLPGVEDFGITPLEAMASGAPVIALNAGGAVESVGPGCGILFSPQTADALQKAVLDIETGKVHFDPAVLRARAAEFSKVRFTQQMAQQISTVIPFQN